MRRRGSAINSVSFFAFQDIITSVVGIFVLIMLIMVLELAQTVAQASQSSQSSVSQTMLDDLAKLQRDVEELEAQYEKMQSRAASVSVTNRFTREEEATRLKEQMVELQDQLDRSSQRLRDLKEQQAVAKQMAKALADEDAKRKSALAADQQTQRKRKSIERYTAILETSGPLIFRDRTGEGRSLCLVLLETSSIKVSDSESKLDLTFSKGSRTEQFAAWLGSVQLQSRHFLVIIKPSGIADFEAVRKALEHKGATFGFDVADEAAAFRLLSSFGEDE